MKSRNQFVPPWKELKKKYFNDGQSKCVRLIQCDLEVQLAILTDNEELRTKFREERIRLFQYGTLVTSNAFKQLSRLVPFWGPLLMRIFRNFFLNDLHLE
ncbi:unnamed protein product [Rotaria magnacalcarata]|uniref:Uncharacterized protein n=2 Tax=Rotaria magnacalcarata TaxID=392030 RepID=A0A816FQ13_9BILA|nr:unnamed protein product [Rotaria magnacalcarata]